ncbi:GNAT family N-acetyltransferase [Nocardioides sp.]|uniref:GNAT family N-acetyltransferase n=1 Tax=Nocardioides sp. TaxID=35761 RepID=UPI002B275A98|nr:GNAT family N-acetyltransferase [Nocardioides sp.]
MNTGQHLLGPHVVGTRVVVRRVVPGEQGPTGGPALTDLLGECVAWSSGADGTCVVRPADGPDVEIALRDIVSGKPVPPRPSVRSRVTPEQAQRHAFALFPDLVTEPVGSWVLRDSATATARRAHSVLAFGPSGVEDDVARVVAHYERPVAAVLTHSPEHERLLSLGWVPESRDGSTVFQVAGTAQVARALRRGTTMSTTEPVLDEAVPGAWARAEIEGLATGYAGFADDWVGFAGIEVSPTARRQGLGRAVMAALLDWGAEQGATTAYLQVLDDNRPALALYEALGFREHHRYCYLTTTAVSSAG